jgi:hypothetical protein
MFPFCLLRLARSLSRSSPQVSAVATLGYTLAPFIAHFLSYPGTRLLGISSLLVKERQDGSWANESVGVGMLDTILCTSNASVDDIRCAKKKRSVG